MRRHVGIVGALLLALAACPVLASDWGTIVPGISTQATVRAQYGSATKTVAGQLEGYDTMQWIYEGGQAPVGMVRMVVDFGLLTAAGYKADVVRDFRLEPKPGVFTQQTILMGWGRPSRAGREENTPVFFYEEGLVVYFDKEGWLAERMIFTPRQPPLGR
jgi:hypothetical protein